MVTIGGITLRVRSEDPRLKPAALGPGAGFLSDSATDPGDTYDVIAAREHLEPASSSTEIFRTESWRLHRDDAGRFIFEAWSSNVDGHPIRRAILDESSRTILASISESFGEETAPMDPIEYPIDELLMINLLPERRGIEVHACGVILDGRGYLFAGMSEAGKTTTARMISDRHPGAVICSDDRIIIRRTGEKFELFGTPWHGEAKLSSSLHAPLHRVLFLEQADRTSVEPIPIPEALSRLITCSFIPFYRRELVEKSLSTAAEISEELRPERYRFTLDPASVDAVLG